MTKDVKYDILGLIIINRKVNLRYKNWIKWIIKKKIWNGIIFKYE